MRSKKGIPWTIVWYFFQVWVQRCPRVVPGTLPGSLQGQMCSKMGLKMTRKSSKILPAGFLKTLLKDTRTEHVSKQLWAFFQFAPIHAEGDSVSHLSKQSPDTHPLGQGEKPTVDASQMCARCLSDASRCLPDAPQFPPSPAGVQDSLSPGAETKKHLLTFL